MEFIFVLGHGHDKEEFAKLPENDKVVVKRKENSHQGGKILKLSYSAARSKICSSALEKLLGSIF